MKWVLIKVNNWKKFGVDSTFLKLRIEGYVV